MTKIWKSVFEEKLISTWQEWGILKVKKNILPKVILIVSMLMLLITGCEGRNSVDNEVLYGNTIAALGDNERIAFVDIGEKNDVLFTAGQTQEDGQGNNTAMFCNVYFAVDGEIYDLGGIESMGTAYPVRHGEKCIYTASGNSLVIYTIDVETHQLTASSRYLVTYDEEGNVVYSCLKNGKEQEISEDEFQSAFESYIQSDVISFDRYAVDVR